MVFGLAGDHGQRRRPGDLQQCGSGRLVFLEGLDRQRRIVALDRIGGSGQQLIGVDLGLLIRDGTRERAVLGSVGIEHVGVQQHQPHAAPIRLAGGPHRGGSRGVGAIDPDDDVGLPDAVHALPLPDLFDPHRPRIADVTLPAARRPVGVYWRDLCDGPEKLCFVEALIFDGVQEADQLLFFEPEVRLHDGPDSVKVPEQ